VTETAVARVLIDSPLPQLDRLFDYRIPEHLAEVAAPGVRVTAPLRSAGRTVDGFLIEVVPEGEHAGEYSGPLAELESVVSPIPVLVPEVYRLARAAATRAAGVASDIVRLAVPKRQVRVEKAFLARERREPEPYENPTDLAVTGYRDLEVGGGTRLAMDAIPGVVETADSAWVGRWARTAAELCAAQLAEGRSAIVALPDYRDQKQLAAVLSALVPAERIVHLDAKQSNPDRYRAFLRCLEGHPVVVIGNRSVVYAPAASLGLIVVWDDGDPLHAEPLAPYVHTRDASLLRQEQSGCALVMLGHTRSTEVERLVEIGYLASASPRPAVAPHVVPTAQQHSEDRFAAMARIPSSAWRAARAGLDEGPVLVQVARPGYAPRLACADCRQLARCTRCSGPLEQRGARAVPSCAWCGALAVDWSCSNCEGSRLRLVGIGAGRTAEELGRAFPGVRVIVADGERPILDVGPEPALVIATRGAEPIAAGGYRAVLLLDGESMSARESLRVAEDCLRWWSNAAALAAPKAPVMLVGVGGALARTLATWTHADHARAELVDRRELRFPPAVRVATVTGDERAVTDAVAALDLAPLDILGPVDLGEGKVRTIVRFDYSRGAAVAEELRAAVVRIATGRRKPTTPGGRPPPRPTLRVRFDDVEPFLES
jgi:primosomal protein N' (replication factor Y)